MVTKPGKRYKCLYESLLADSMAKRIPFANRTHSTVHGCQVVARVLSAEAVWARVSIPRRFVSLLVSMAIAQFLVMVQHYSYLACWVPRFQALVDLTLSKRATSTGRASSPRPMGVFALAWVRKSGQVLTAKVGNTPRAHSYDSDDSGA